jgi:L-ascorbate metabolism protein UlaG (beta-lactamase superfamily)
MSESDNVHLTYIGGPTILIEFDALRLLTDPTFDPPGNYETGAFTLSKLTGPAISASEIGSIDVVLLSHDHHFDNLDRAGRELLQHRKKTVIELTERFLQKTYANIREEKDSRHGN